VPALTETEAQARAALLTIRSYDVSLDLTATPARSRTVIRFGCARPGADSFAELTARVAEGGAALNEVPLGPAGDGRLALAGLAAQNVLTVDAEIPERALTRFTEPSGGEYVLAFAYPTGAPDLFCCFDQLDLPAPLTLSLRAPAGWTCVANGAVASRPAAGTAGTWRFAPLRVKPLELTFCAGPLRARAVPPAGAGVTLTSYGRAGLAGATPGYLARFCAIAETALRHYERELGVPCPYRECDIVALPDVPFRAACVPGLMLVGEDLLARLADPDDDFAVMIAAHEVAHFWFGCLVGMRWWDDLWLEETLATYLSFRTDASWTYFAYDEKPRALRADELPTTQPVSSPVATMDQAVDRPNAITYVKGTAVVRQLAALIGAAAVTRGLADYLTRFAAVGSARLDDLVACWSKASGRDLTGWAQAWLRAPGTPRLAARLTESPDARIASLTVTQDVPRPHRVGVALYDTVLHDTGLYDTGLYDTGLYGTGRKDTGEPRKGLRHRRTDLVELTGTATDLPGLAGEPAPAAVFVNAQDRALAQVTIDDQSLAALADVAFDVGDPLTEAACWNAAWHMVLTAGLPASGYAAMVARRLAGGTRSAGNLTGQDPAASPLPTSAAEALLGRAVTCADRYVPRDGRTAVRVMIADAALRAAQSLSAPGPLRRVLLAGFAASAATDSHLAAVRALLDDEVADLTLRAALVKALAIRDRATPADLAALTSADPVAGRPLQATCEAARPDQAAKEAAWTAALDQDTPQFLARAHADGIWIAGQEHLLAGYRDRYFTEALPVLSASDARGERRARRLAGMLFPVTFDDETTLAAVRTALDAGAVTHRLRAVLQEQEAELRTALTVKAAATALRTFVPWRDRRWIVVGGWQYPVPCGPPRGSDVDRRGMRHCAEPGRARGPRQPAGPAAARPESRPSGRGVCQRHGGTCVERVERVESEESTDG
jgi:aminopeptidase N